MRRTTIPRRAVLIAIVVVTVVGSLASAGVIGRGSLRRAEVAAQALPQVSTLVVFAGLLLVCVAGLVCLYLMGTGRNEDEQAREPRTTAIRDGGASVVPLAVSRGAVIDATQGRSIENELRESRERLAQIAEHSRELM